MQIYFMHTSICLQICNTHIYLYAYVYMFVYVYMAIACTVDHKSITLLSPIEWSTNVNNIKSIHNTTRSCYILFVFLPD